MTPNTALPGQGGQGGRDAASRSLHPDHHDASPPAAGGAATGAPCSKCEKLFAQAPARFQRPSGNGTDDHAELAHEGRDHDDHDAGDGHEHTPSDAHDGHAHQHGHGDGDGAPRSEHADSQDHAHASHAHGGHDHGGHDHGGHDHGEQVNAATGVWQAKRELIAVGISGVAFGIAFLAQRLGVPEPVIIALYLVSILAGATEIVPRGIKGVLKERSLDINFLITLAVIGAVVLQQWGEGAAVVFLFSLGEALESLTLARTRRSIQALMAMAPETAQVKGADGAEQTVPVEQVKVGTIAVVRPGDRIPLDGVITEGESSIDQAPITGESVPVDKAKGDTVYAGTINGSGYLELKTSKPFAENTLSRIITLVESAQSEKAPSQRFVEKFARIYTPVVVLIAVLIAVLPPLLFGQPFVEWFNRALVMLLIACPCALVISTPVSVVAAIGNASRNGVLIKGGAYLERAGTLRAVAFDKTGTLTRGVPEVQRIVPLNGLAERDILRLTAAAEGRSEHPLAEAIVRYAHHQGVGDLPPVEQFQATTGNGVQATVEGQRLLIGKPKWLESNGLALDRARSALDAFAAAGQTAIMVAHAGGDGNPTDAVAVIGIADELRENAAAAIRSLRQGGVQRIVLLSGDNAATAKAIAAQVGIAPEDVRAELLPEDKVTAIKELIKEHRSVAMVGDGVNDGPALAASTVGIAMGAGGSDTALETADVALVADDLLRVPWVLDLSRRAARTVKVNIGFALLTKAVVIVLAAFGLANLWMAIATDTGATVLVILNGMRLLGNALPAVKGGDVDAARRRFGLGKEDPHAGHAH